MRGVSGSITQCLASSLSDIVLRLRNRQGSWYQCNQCLCAKICPMGHGSPIKNLWVPISGRANALKVSPLLVAVIMPKLLQLCNVLSRQFNPIRHVLSWTSNVSAWLHVAYRVFPPLWVNRSHRGDDWMHHQASKKSGQLCSSSPPKTFRSRHVVIIITHVIELHILQHRNVCRVFYIYTFIQISQHYPFAVCLVLFCCIDITHLNLFVIVAIIYPHPRI